MKTIFLFVCLLIGCATESFCQQLPVGSCGIVYVHDAAGNRTKRVYFCNNGVDPYPQRTAQPGLTDPKEKLFTEKEIKNMEIAEVDALYPNPTSGIFSIGFSRSLNNASIDILDINGRAVQHIKASGLQVKIDLSLLPAGTYFVRINDNGNIISKKVIRQ